MSVTMPRMMLMACLLSPSLSWALGLGEIHLNSALNEPMNADIDLIAASPDELAALRATLANRESFTRYGIDRPAFLSSLTFKVGKSKDGRDALLVRSTEAIPEPFVTFLVEANWNRGRLMREYTVLLDPPVYTPGETPSNSAPVSAPATTPPARRTPPAASAAENGANSATPGSNGASNSSSAGNSASGANSASSSNAPGTYRVGRGDTLAKIARSLHAESGADVDQTMIALYRSNPEAFGGNINVLRQGAILRVPGADQIAATNQKDAMNEVRRQMSAWRGADTTPAPTSGHLRLVTPTTGATAVAGGAGGTGSASGAEAQALKDRVKDLESQVAEQKRLIDIRNAELSALQHKVASVPPASPPTPAATAAAPPTSAPAPAATPSASVPAPTSVTPPPAAPSASTQTPLSPPSASTPASAASAASDGAAQPPVTTPLPPKKPPTAAQATEPETSWIDWVTDNWWLPLALLVAGLAGLAFAAMKRRRQDQADDLNAMLEEGDGTDPRDPTSKLTGIRKGNESFVVEESGPHVAPEFEAEPLFGDVGEPKSPDDTMSSESAVNLDQGDPLAEADFHMAYGLYDQAADLVRIALEREPDRRDLRLKLLEIYFVWGNKDAFLQTAKSLEATRDQAPAGEWDKIAIMGRQICPGDPMFNAATGSGRGAGALVDLNLEGGENHVDIDLFGDPEGEHSRFDEPHATTSTATDHFHDSPRVSSSDDLDFTLDAPERGADESPTREMPPPHREEPTVESELFPFMESPTLESPAATESPTTESPTIASDRFSSKLPPQVEQTAEVSVDDLGLDLEHNEHLEETDHPSDAPTMLAGFDERSRKMMEDAEARSHDRDLTELERELEASFTSTADEPNQDDIKTEVLGPESAPTVLMPREDLSPTSRIRAPDLTDLDVHDLDSLGEHDGVDLDSTSKLKGIHSDSIDLDLDRLASALSGGGDTVDQPRAAEDIFSNEVFDATQRNKLVDLDVGEPMIGNDSPTNRVDAETNKLSTVDEDLGMPELEPVTMSEVGTKLDLARAYMDMGDPEGARSILEEVVQEGTASQKQEAARLIESLPG